MLECVCPNVAHYPAYNINKNADSTANPFLCRTYPRYKN
jgi:hypothetical protein